MVCSECQVTGKLLPSFIQYCWFGGSSSIPRPIDFLRRESFFVGILTYLKTAVTATALCDIVPSG